MTLTTTLVLLLAPAGSAYALGLGSVFSDAEVDISLVEQSKDRVVIDVRGTGYSGKTLEIALNPSGYLGSGTRSTFIKSVAYDPGGSEDWSSRFTLDAAQIAQLEPDTSYQIMTMRANGRDVLSSGDTRTTKIPFDFDQLTQPESSPSPQQPGGGADGAGGSPSGDGSGGASGKTGRGTTGETGSDGDGAGVGSAEKDEKGSTDDTEKSPWKAPEEPPTTTGIELGGAERSVDAGDVIRASASGFEPNETDIKVVVYSTPIVLSTSVKANGHGVASWSGRLPQDIGLGKHTLTFQGSVDRGVTFIVTGAPADGECADGACTKVPTTQQTPAAASAGESSSMGWLTWVIVAVMIALAALAGTIAMLSGRRRSDPDDWHDPRHDPRHGQRRAHYAEPGYAYQQPRGEHPSRRQVPDQLPPDQLQQNRYRPTHAQPPQPQAQQQPQPSHRGQPAPPPAQRQPPPQPGQQSGRQSARRQPARRQPAQQPPQPQPQQPAQHKPRPPESFAPPKQRAEAFAPWR
ncbi:hypothetical protein [Nocardioides albertanoniae]|uniref:hypothetical protein n=1 Tax=Nocardioides albertanoniae TaxID=1175486 RepID=UPI001151D9DB|nr:hypothetical protein [Nocardioides albertanoniae]